MAEKSPTPDPTPRPAPWLIAAWPGMGTVAVIAAGYLVRELKMKEAGELPSRDHFDVAEVVVKRGLVEQVRLPRGVFFRWKNPKPTGRDLVVFLGEAQPTSGSYAYAHELLHAARQMGVERVITFASMASGLHPSENPKVSGVATDRATLDELRRAEVQPLNEAQIGGLNGLVLATAAEMNMPGFCLLAEIPFFAAAVPNPKAARAALSVFSVLAGIDISLEELNKHAAAIDRALIEAYDKIKVQQEAEGEQEPEGEEPKADEPGVPGAEGGEKPAKLAKPEQPEEPEKTILDYTTRRRIEHLFQEARKDQSRAVDLKKELDKLGVFRQYEDRFLDLFRRAD